LRIRDPRVCDKTQRCGWRHVYWGWNRGPPPAKRDEFGVAARVPGEYCEGFGPDWDAADWDFPPKIKWVPFWAPSSQQPAASDTTGALRSVLVDVRTCVQGTRNSTDANTLAVQGLEITYNELASEGNLSGADPRLERTRMAGRLLQGQRGLDGTARRADRCRT